MQIEIADIQDAPAILALQKLAFQSEAALCNDYTLPPLTQTLEELELDFHECAFLKGVVDGTIVGSVRGNRRGETCYIGRLVVHPEFQNQGLGAQLLAAMESHFAQAQRCELFTGQKSARNLYFYQKLGYRIFRTDQTAGQVPLVYFEKRLTYP